MKVFNELRRTVISLQFILRQAGLDSGEEGGIETAIDSLFEVSASWSGGRKCGFDNRVHDFFGGRSISRNVKIGDAMLR
jgi:hypothetical protein